MAHKIRIYLQLLTYGVIFNLSYAIIGRHIVRAYNYPFVVSLSKKLANVQHHPDLHYCTGSLISRRSVVTAAHCLLHKNVSDVQIIAGSNNLIHGQIYEPKRWITYDEWMHGRTGVPSLSDIAIIILRGEGVNGQHIIPLEVLPYDPDYQYEKRVYLAGWGKTQSGRMILSLKRAATTIITNEECNRRGSIVRGELYSVPPNYFCSAASPWILTSYGDGGAPVMFNEREQTPKLVGINIGTVPVTQGRWHAENTDRLNEVQVNTHLRLRHYREFILTFTL